MLPRAAPSATTSQRPPGRSFWGLRGVKTGAQRPGSWSVQSLEHKRSASSSTGNLARASYLVRWIKTREWHVRSRDWMAGLSGNLEDALLPTGPRTRLFRCRALWRPTGPKDGKANEGQRPYLSRYSTPRRQLRGYGIHRQTSVKP